MGARRVFGGTGVISAPLTGVASFEIQSGVFSPKVLYKDRRFVIPSMKPKARAENMPSW